MYSIPMALVDFLPVCFFGYASLILQKDLYNKMSKGAFSLFCAGTIDVFMAGFLKALYKLLYAAGVCDFQPLNSLFFPLQALGFMLAGVGILCLVIRPQGKNKLYSVAAPVLFKGTFIFVAFMVLGLLLMNTGLAVFARKMKKTSGIIFFIIAFIFSLMMGYLSSRDFSQNYMHWIAETVNVIGQFAMLIGVKILDKAGLEKFQLRAD